MNNISDIAENAEKAFGGLNLFTAIFIFVLFSSILFVLYKLFIKLKKLELGSGAVAGASLSQLEDGVAKVGRAMEEVREKINKIEVHNNDSKRQLEEVVSTLSGIISTLKLLSEMVLKAIPKGE